jgi:hypothetical protein
MVEYKSNRGVAQLAARTHGVREVRGSNPRTPTKWHLTLFYEGCKWLFELIGRDFLFINR